MKKSYEMLFRFVFSIMVVVFCRPGFGAAGTLPAGSVKIPVLQTPDTDRIPFYTERREADWKPAFWIHCQAANEATNAYSLFRREVDLSDLPASAVLHVAADDRYRVWVNGTLVANGSTPHEYVHMSYESYEIAPLLKAGANALALEVFMDAPDRAISVQHKIPSCIMTAVLEVSQDGNSYQTLVATDETWLSLPGVGWLTGVGKSTMHDFSEVFNSMLDPRGWRSPGFRESRWQPALIVKPVLENGRTYATRQPLQKLMPRPMPRLAREFVQPKSIVEAGEVVCFQLYGPNDRYPAVKALSEQMQPSKHCRIEGAENLLLQEPQGVCVIENEFAENNVDDVYRYWKKWDDIPLIRHASIIVDMGELMNGYFMLEVEGQQGAMIDISYDQTLTDGRVIAVPLVNWNQLGQGHGQLFKTDRLILSGGRQVWTGFQLRNHRYVQLTFRNLGGPLKLSKFGVIKESLPYGRHGAFRCSDPFLNRLWDADSKSFHALVHNIPVDNMTREKSPWGGDCAAVVNSALALYGDLPVLQHYLNLFRWTQGESGAALSKAWVPRYLEKSYFNEPLGNFPFHMILQSHAAVDHARYTGDVEFNKGVVQPFVTGQIDFYLGNYLDPVGLIGTNMKFWYDWAPIPPRGTISFVGNAIFVQLLEKTADLLGRSDSRAAVYQQAAERIRAKLAQDFWVEERGLYSDAMQDGVLMESFSEHAAVMALGLGLTPDADGRQEKMLSALRRNADGFIEMIEFNLPFAKFAWENLFEVDPSLCLDLMRERYGRCLREGAVTLPEEWSSPYLSTRFPDRTFIHYRAVAQTANGAPSFYLHAHLLGVRPKKAGFAEFVVAPKPVDLDWAEGAVPSPFGLIPVRWDREGDKFTLKVTVPTGSEALVRLPAGYRLALLNGKKIKDQEVRLAPGTFTLVGRK